MIACTLPALTDFIPERKRKELAGEVTRELQVVGNVASIAIRTWVRNNDNTKARAEEREKNIGWIGRMFTAWRVSHAERREEREAAGEDNLVCGAPADCLESTAFGAMMSVPHRTFFVVERIKESFCCNQH